MTAHKEGAGPRSFAQALEKTIAHSGIQVLNGETQLYSLVADYLGGSPQSRQSLNLLRNAIDCGVPAQMYGGIDKGTPTQTITVATCRKLLMDNYSISEEAAGQFMDGFAAALGWKVAPMTSAASPAPAEQKSPSQKVVTGTATGTMSASKPVAPSPKPVTVPVKPTAPPTDPAMERIGNLCVTVPEQWFGNVMGEINRRRGQVRNLDTPKSGDFIIHAQVPELEMDDFHTFLAKLTLEKGRFTYSYDHDQPMPENVAERQKSKAE